MQSIETRGRSASNGVHSYYSGDTINRLFDCVPRRALGSSAQREGFYFHALRNTLNQFPCMIAAISPSL
jgi:hypothetical protein